MRSTWYSQKPDFAATVCDHHNPHKMLVNWKDAWRAEPLHKPTSVLFQMCVSMGEGLNWPSSAHTPIERFLEKRACCSDFGSDICCLASGNEFGNWRTTLMCFSTTLSSFCIIYSLDNIQSVHACLFLRQDVHFLKAG